MTILSELNAEILKKHSGRPFWKMAATEAVESFRWNNGVLASTNVCLDINLTILSEVKWMLRYWKNYFDRPFWKMAATESVGSFRWLHWNPYPPKNVCLDTKMTILREIEAKIFKNM